MAAVPKIGAILPAVIGHAKRRHGALEAIRRQWRTLVGTPLAAHTKPVSLQHGRLVVHVDGPGDGFALSYQRARILQRLSVSAAAKVEELIIRPRS